MKRTLVTVAAMVTAFTAAPATAAAAPTTGAPAGFAPAAMSWLDDQRGSVLGFAPCAAGQCATLVRTWDGGATWLRTNGPDLPAEARSRLQFADAVNGLATDGTTLYSTHTGGLVWRQVTLPGTPRIRRLAATTHTFYAITSTDTGTRLLSAPKWSDHWRPVPGVDLPASGSGDIITDGRTVHVALTAVYRAHGYWTRTGRGPWQAQQPPCQVGADADLGRSGGTVHVLCSYNPGMGAMFKDLYRANGDGTFTSLGPAPVIGITEAFAMADPSTAMVAAVGRGAAFLYRGTISGNSTTWRTAVTLPGQPWLDLQFPTDKVGEVLHGGPRWSDAVIYRTEDAGRTWSPLAL